MNVVGRQCDRCLAGHYAFPYCEYCQCDTRGTLENICDQATAECFCKKNVVGPQCETCREGTFDLQESNEDGCAECFCFGKTTRCTGSQLVKTSIYQMDDWQIVGLNLSSKLDIVLLNLTVQRSDEDSINVDFTVNRTKNITSYFTAPQKYLGKKLSSYGGFLNYTIYYTIGEQGSAVSEPDVILQGKKMFLTYSSFGQPTALIEYPASVQLIETNFETPTGGRVKRDQIMEVLEDLRAIYIRGTYWTDTVTTRLTKVLQDDAIAFHQSLASDRNLAFATSVEECRCPDAYQGLSCEECAPGYYRIESGPHGGYCVPCQCSGHATECDLYTGVCINCTHNTRGDHCELCAVGYHGNALAGTPMDCLICACPLPTTSNNFATGCEVSSDGEKISCDCRKGYFGGKCESCAAGYYGRPEVLGDYCKPCECSGNIDADVPGSCDTVSGECLRCLNNTFGIACGLCAPGYFGDAVTLKDCQSCICDKLGIDHCNSNTGECVCKPNVIGEKCDRCKLEHYGFQSGAGCVPCDCEEASDSTQCDDVTGQCRCKPGVTGRTCDRCSAGFWNYTSEGCVSCGCKSEYSLGFGCNALTGQCECLQGVIGEKCNQCPHRWVFVPEYGCHQCDSCTHALLDTTDSLRALIDPVILDFDSANSGYFTRRKLENIRELLINLQPKFDDVDPRHINLDTHVEELESLEQDSKNLNRKANYSLEKSESLKTGAIALREEAEILLDDFSIVEDESLRVIDGIDKISFQLNADDNPEIDLALQEGKELVNNIKKYNFSNREELVNKENDKVNAIITNVTNFKIPIDYLEDKTNALKTNLIEFNDVLDDLYNQTQYSLNKANEAQRIMAKSGKDRLKKKLEDIDNQSKESENNLVISQSLNDNSTQFNKQAQDKIEVLKDLYDKLEDHNSKFKLSLDNNEDGIIEVKELAPAVEIHAKNLTERAMALDNLLTESRDLSGSAVKAAKAYGDIVKAVKDARSAAEGAQEDAYEASDLLVGIETKTFNADQNSSDALKEAFESYHATNDDLKPKLELAISKYKPVADAHKTNDQQLNDMNKILENMQAQSLEQSYVIASNKADNAINHVKNIEDTANETFVELKSQTEQAKLLPKNLDDMKRDLLQTQKQLLSVNDKLPRIIEIIDKIPKEQQKLQNSVNNIENSLEKLKQQIILARDIANQVKIGMRFYPNTTLELRNPSNLESLSTSTHISGYFKTRTPNGLLWYLGNPVGTNLRRTKTDDYMALVVQNGYPVLKFELGNGPEQLINEKYVSDNTWYQFIIDRIGHNAKLSIREELPGGVENITQSETTLDGPYSIFNLDRNKSKLFVGSFPVNYELQPEIDFNSFDGEIEDIVIGDKPVSLWNFNHGYENNHGAIERNKLVNLQSSTGYRFNGNGFVVMDARSYSFRSKSDIQLRFKTFATEGLLFLAGKGKTFIALELRNGKVLYQYNLGAETKTWHTRNAYNDGRWHEIQASRDGPNGRFIVDGEDMPDTTGPISGNLVEPFETISFGGFPNKHNYITVTQTQFDGCIDNVVIMGSALHLGFNVKSYDVTPGCPVKVAQMVSFDKPGYLAHGGLSVNNDFKISLKFKTKQTDGLIFYGTDNLQTANISLALRKGHLVLISQKLELVSKDTFNDSEWHVVSVMHNNNQLRVDFDDYGFKTTDSGPAPLHFLHGTIYIGGLPRRLFISPGTVGSTKPFRGCIADLTLKGNVVNFANTTDKFNNILGKCILDKGSKLDKIDNEPQLPPLEPLPPATRAPIKETTLNPFDVSTKIRGDGGLDYYHNETQEPIPQTETVPTPPTQPPTIEGRVGTPPPTTPKTIKEGCSLPEDPPLETPGAFRFGAQKDSRLEFDKFRGKHKKEFEFVLDIKTEAADGLVFYVANEKHTEYVAVFLQNRQIVYTFGNSVTQAIIRTNNTYNDNQWHIIEFTRNGGHGKLIVDKSEYDTFVPQIEDLNIKVPTYVGGLDPQHYNLIQGKINITKSFQGCIRSIIMNRKSLIEPNRIGVVPCFDNVESGTFFPVTGGFVRLREPRFKVGDVFNIKLDVKPRRDSGVLIAAQGKRDYFVLEMVDGEMRLTVENGRGPIKASFNSNKKFYFCDGNWHSIQAVKSKNVVTLSVDNVFTEPNLGDHSETSTDTGSALFLGGHRFLTTRAKGVATKLPFVGCVKNVFINDEPVEILANMAEENVIVGTCPTN